MDALRGIEKSEDAKRKMIREINLTETLLKNGDITQDQYNTVIEFLRAEIGKYDRGSYVGFGEASIAMQSLSRDEIYSIYGIDVTAMMGRFSSFYDYNRYARFPSYSKRYTEIDYAREMTNKWSDEIPAYANTPVVYAANVGISYSADFSDLTDDQAEMIGREIGKAMDLETAKIFSGQYGSGAAEIVWNEYGGVILCECDSVDCDSRVEVTHEEYLHASGHGGYYRVTHPDCSYGVLGAYLVERGKNYHVWTKMA